MYKVLVEDIVILFFQSHLSIGEAVLFFDFVENTALTPER
jgi:hypothetical protein